MTYLSHILATSFLLLVLAFTVVAVPYEAGVDGPEPQPPLPRGPPPPEDQSQQEQAWPDEHEHPNPHPHHNHGHKPQPTKPNPKRKKPRFGISYSPYTSAGTCKTQEQVDHDLAAISKTEQGANDDEDDEDVEYGFVRIYGTDCNQTATVSTAARRYNMRVFAGVFDLNGFPGSLDPIIQVGTSPSRSHSKAEEEEGEDDDNWSIFHTISIGNELIQKTNTPETIHSVTEALHEARSILRSKGYKGPVVTVDTYSILLQHPEVCHASDYCATNCHVFFDATQGPHGAGTYARDVARKISQKAGGKRTVIAESGWPHAGLPNGKAVPGVEEQRAAIGNLKQVFGQGASGDDGDAGLVLFTAFDDLWKEDNEGTFGAERFWGIH